MVPSIRMSRAARLAFPLYVAAFLLFLFAPLVVAGAFAFNDSAFPSPPWEGFTLDWFVGQGEGGRVGVFFDDALLNSLWISLQVALGVTVLSVAVGTSNAFLLERAKFPGKTFLSIAMLWPLVIPGVILGVSILSFSSRIANGLDDAFGIEAEVLRPGLPLVILGQFSFIATIATLIVSARLRKFDVTLEEAALNLGATKTQAFLTVTAPFLAPALVGAAVTGLLMSFENFNTTFMLVGSDQPLTVAMYNRMRDGATPALNAVSLLLICASALLALALGLTSGRKEGKEA